MLWVSLAAAVYLGATLFWLAAMALSAALGCDGGCGESEVHRLDVREVLALIALAIAAAAFLCSLFSRWLGLSLLALHAVVFAVNPGVFRDLADTPWVLIPPASLTAAVGYVAVGVFGEVAQVREPEASRIGRRSDPRVLSVFVLARSPFRPVRAAACATRALLVGHRLVATTQGAGSGLRFEAMGHEPRRPIRKKSPENPSCGTFCRRRAGVLGAALEPLLQLLHVPGHFRLRLPADDERQEDFPDPVPFEIERQRHSGTFAVPERLDRAFYFPSGWGRRYREGSSFSEDSVRSLHSSSISRCGRPAESQPPASPRREGRPRARTRHSPASPGDATGWSGR
jgi:hypothetical protein